MSTDKPTKQTADFSASRANEKANLLLGSLMAYNIRVHGKNLPTVYAQVRNADPLPGENLEDNSHITELEKIIGFKSDR